MISRYVEHKLFVCDCETLSHQLIVSKYTHDEYDDEDVYLTVGIAENLPFFKRLLYLCGFIKTPQQVEIILSPDKVKELVNCLN